MLILRRQICPRFVPSGALLAATPRMGTAVGLCKQSAPGAVGDQSPIGEDTGTGRKQGGGPGGMEPSTARRGKSWPPDTLVILAWKVRFIGKKINNTFPAARFRPQSS